MGVGDTNGNEAATLPVGLPMSEPAPPALPWDNVRLGAEPPSSRAAGWNNLRPLLHDGPAALESLSIIRVTSPRCGHVVSVDPVAIVTRGTGRLAFSAAAPAELVDDVMRAFQLSSRDFDGRLVLTGTNGLAPSFAVLRCEQCVQMHLTVVSYGEVQPERFQLVFEGLTAIDDLSPAITLAADPTGTAGTAGTTEHGAGFPALHGPGGNAGPWAEAERPLIDLTDGASASPASPHGATALGAAALGVERSRRSRARRRGGPIAVPPPAPSPDFGARLAIVAALVVVVAVLIWVHLSTWAAWSRSGGLANTGTATVAEVVASESIDNGSDKTYSITYRYKAVDRQGRATDEPGQQTVDRETFEAARDRPSINVRYDPDDPSRSALARDDDLTLRYILVVVLDLAALLAALRLRPVLRRHF